MNLIYLFLEFFKIGLFSFGGGMAMLPLIEKAVLHHNWLTHKEFSDIIAISQITPGPIAINTATFVGNKVAGIPGAILATIACALPSFIIILIISKVFSSIKENKYKIAFFKGVEPVILALITYAGYIIAKPIFYTPNDTSLGIKTIILFFISFVAVLKIKINPVFILIGTAILGYFIC